MKKIIALVTAAFVAVAFSSVTFGAHKAPVVDHSVKHHKHQHKAKHHHHHAKKPVKHA